MIFYTLILLIVLIWVVLDFFRLLKLITKGLHDRISLILGFLFVLMIAVIYFGGQDANVMDFLNGNRGLYLFYLISATLWAILNCILVTKDR